jgi:hypothetical protein
MKPGSHISCSQEVQSMGEWENWTSTLPSELPLWELKSQWTPKSSNSDCRGQNPLNWGVLYIIEKLLKLRCLKWACMTNLEIWNISYGQKKGQESNCQIDSQVLKVGNRPDFLMCRWRATYQWKDFDEGYNFVSYLISIGDLHIKLWPRKVARVSTLGILGLPFGSPGKKWHLGVSPMAMHKVYYKGEGGGFPQVRAVVSFVSMSLPVARLSTKSAPTIH